MKQKYLSEALCIIKLTILSFVTDVFHFSDHGQLEQRYDFTNNPSFCILVIIVPLFW